MESLHYTTEDEMEDIFGSSNTTAFDGVHPKGRFGAQLYNEGLIAAVRTAGIYNRRERVQREQGIPTSNIYSQLN